MKTRTDDLLALLCKALTERYPDDPSVPGVQIAHLPAGRIRDTACWYVACHRYTQAFGGGRVIQAKKEGDDLDDVLRELATEIAESTPAVSAQRALVRALG